MHRGLRGAPRGVASREGVEPVLENIEIERAQFHDAEIVQCMIDAVEIEVLVESLALQNQGSGALEHPAIEFSHLLLGNGVARRIEIRKIAEGEAERISNLAIGLGELRHDTTRPTCVCRTMS